MKKIVGMFPDNMLKDIHSRLTALPNLFRDKIGEECLWSTPTFYRKLKSTSPISNAEKEKIMAVLDEALRNLWDHLGRYRTDRE